MAFSSKSILESINKSGNMSLSSIFNAKLLSNIENIKDYNEKMVYNKGDIIYVNKDVYPYHFFYEAKENKITGAFNPEKWTDASLDNTETNRDNKCIGDIHVIELTEENITQHIFLNSLGIENVNEKELLVFADGVLVEYNTYIIKNNNEIIFMNSVLGIKSLKLIVFNTTGSERYNYHKEYSLELFTNDGGYVSIPQGIYNTDTILVFSNKIGLCKEEIDYTINRNTGIVNIKAINSEDLFVIHHFSNREYGKINNMLITQNIIDTTIGYFVLDVNTWDYVTDDIIVFSDKRGLLPINTLMFDGKKIMMRHDLFSPGEIITCVLMSRYRQMEKNKISVKDLDTSLMTQNVKNTTNTYQFNILYEDVKTIDISYLNILRDPVNNIFKYNVSWEILDNPSGGDVNFHIFNKKYDRFDVEYKGLADDVTVQFIIET